MDSEVLEILSDYTTEIVTAMVLGVVLFLLMRRYFAARRARQWTQDPPVPVTFTLHEPVGEFGAEDGFRASALKEGEPHEINQWELPAPQVAPTARLQAPMVIAAPEPEQIPPSMLATASALPEQPQQPASNVANFGAYRIEQEVGKLVAGQPHRVEVLASRAPDDRQATEAALMKVLYTPDSTPAMRDKARRALEDYGFIAHRCAELLMAPQIRERATAAQILGTVGEKSALPFLLESLYDTDEAVRLQAVESLGALRLPGAIGALLDLARRHPEIPPMVLTNALNACSVDSLSFLDAPREVFEDEPLLLLEAEDYADGEEFVETPGDFILMPEVQAQEEVTPPEPLMFPQSEPAMAAAPSGGNAGLPSGDNDEQVRAILLNLERADLERQAELLRSLGQHRTELSLETLTRAATYNPEPSLRAAAVSGLCDLDHPAGFSAMLLAVGDESREVRASAARSLSRLSFDRSEAYQNLIQEETPERLSVIAQACIKAGMATQALDRLAGSDPRQSYESYAMLSMLTKAGEFGPLLDAVANHRNKDVRLNTLRLLIETPGPNIANQLRQLAISEGISDEMRNALLEAIYKIEDGNRRRRETQTAANDNVMARVA
jgi:HEAT repeat protein